MGRRFWLLAGAAAGFCVAAVMVIGLGRLPPWGAFLVSDAAQLVGGAAATVACWWTARRRRGAERRWRVWMGVGMAGWTGGMVIRTMFDIAGRPQPGTPSVADLGFFMLPLCALPALLAFASVAPAYGEERGSPARPVAWTRTIFLLDGLVVAASLFLLAWATVLEAVTAVGGPTPSGAAVAVAYPVSRLMLLTMMVLLVSYHRVQQPRQLLLFGLSLVALAVSEAVNAYVVISGGEWTLMVAHAGFIAGPLLMFLAAVATDAPHPRRRERELAGWGHLVLPYVPILIAGGVIVAQTVAGSPLDYVEWFSAFVILTLIVVRQCLSLADNTTLLGRVRQAQQRLVYQASHDPLTGLANQRLFEEQLGDAVWRFRTSGRQFGLLYIDLDDFKAINDDLGHVAGDTLLQAVAARLRGCVAAADLVARLGGDEFAVLLEGDVGLSHRARERVAVALRRPFAVAGRLRTVNASMGVVMADASDPDLSPQMLLRRADAAMYAVKRDRKRPPVTGAATRHRNGVDLDAKLADALRPEAGWPGLDVYYQPIVRIANRELVAVEALARWTCLGVGVVPPDVFVALAEQRGLVAKLDNFVLDRACRDLTAATAGRPPLTFHVNVSATRLGDTELVDRVRDALRRHGIPGERLVLEITETRDVPDFDVAADVIQRLRRHAVRVALDDFGTGYNTLAHLHQFPIDMVKVDQTFAAFSDDPDLSRSDALRSSIVSIARALHVVIVIEGVETESQAAHLAQQGYDLAQGYLYGRPVPLNQLQIGPPASQPA